MVSQSVRLIEAAIEQHGLDEVLYVMDNDRRMVLVSEVSRGVSGAMDRAAKAIGICPSSATKVGVSVVGRIREELGPIHVPPPVERKRKRNDEQKRTQAVYHRYRTYVAKHDHMRALIRQLNSENKQLRKVISDKPKTTVCRKCHKSFDRQGGKQPTRLEQLAGSTRRDRRKIVQGFARRIIELRRGGE